MHGAWSEYCESVTHLYWRCLSSRKINFIAHSSRVPLWIGNRVYESWPKAINYFVISWTFPWLNKSIDEVHCEDSTSWPKKFQKPFIILNANNYGFSGSSANFGTILRMIRLKINSIKCRANRMYGLCLINICTGEWSGQVSWMSHWVGTRICVCSNELVHSQSRFEY